MLAYKARYDFVDIISTSQGQLKNVSVTSCMKYGHSSAIERNDGYIQKIKFKAFHKIKGAGKHKNKAFKGTIKKISLLYFRKKNSDIREPALVCFAVNAVHNKR